MNILVFGAQGSGKSTHAEYIADKLGVPYVYTGDLFRELEKEKSDRGKKIRKLLEEGRLIPDEIAVPAFEEYLKKVDVSKGVVLDGFPRTVPQAESLSIPIDLIIYIELPLDVAVERLLKRGRFDDTPELIKTRIKLFKEKTQPILDYFKQKGVRIVEIDNSPTVEEVRKAIDDLLEK
jgi:adenylate kinase